MARNLLPPLQTKEYYSNVLLVAPDNTPLATVGNDRAEWYICRDLGTEVATIPPYSRTIRLKFEPKGRPESTHGLHAKETQCVVCGAKEPLTLHHVVPRLIRRSFPVEDASRQHLWCLLLCEKHHLEIEKIYAPFLTQSQAFKELQKGTYNAQAPNHTRKALNALRNLTMSGAINSLIVSHPARVASLLTEVGITELPTLEFIETELSKIKKETPKGTTVPKIFAQQFIEEHGGVENVKKLFKELFLQLNPQYLPEVALTDIF